MGPPYSWLLLPIRSLPVRNYVYLFLGRPASNFLRSSIIKLDLQAIYLFPQPARSYRILDQMSKINSMQKQFLVLKKEIKQILILIASPCKDAQKSCNQLQSKKPKSL